MAEIEKNKTKIIQFRISEDEYKTLKNNAKKSAENVSEYARKHTLNTYNLRVNYDEIEQHTKEISEIKSAVNRLIYTLVQSGNYYPPDMESLIKLLNEISEGEKKLIGLFQKSQPKLRREIEKIIRENIENEI